MGARMAGLLLGLVGCSSYGLSSYGDSGAGVEVVEIIVVPKGTTDFGNTSPYGDPSVQTFTMSVKGDNPTSITDIYMDPATTSTQGWTVDTEGLSLPRPLKSGTTLSVDVEFLPPEEGGDTTSYNGTLVIEYEADKNRNTAQARRKVSGKACTDYDPPDGECG